MNFKIVKCGLFINQEHPWIHATPDFLCSWNCCGDGCGEIKCPYCIENCDFDSYLSKPSSCLAKNIAGQFTLLHTHEYHYQVQQQLFTTKLNYNYLIVCTVNEATNYLKFVQTKMLPDKEHWNKVLPKLKKFWRICVLPEVFARWYTRRVNLTRDGHYWLMLCVIADRILRKIPSSAVIQTVPFFNFTCHAWVLMLSPRPGTALNVGLYQNSSEEDRSTSQLA